MGLLDSLKKFFQNVNETGAPEPVKKKNDISNFTAVINGKAYIHKDSAPPKNMTMDELLETGDIPPKTSRLMNADFGDAEVTYMLSGDFIEFNSHCELFPSYHYEPLSNNEYTAFDEHKPALFFGPIEETWSAKEEFLETGVLSDREFNASESEFFLFSAKFDYFGEIMYAYVISEASERSDEVLAVTYDRRIEGSSLEKKLCAALDEAASTYKETKI